MTPSGPLQKRSSINAPSIRPPNARFVCHIESKSPSMGNANMIGINDNNINKVIGRIENAILALPMKSKPGPLLCLAGK